MSEHPVAVAKLGVISNKHMPNKNFYSDGNHDIKKEQEQNKKWDPN
jgi:hypothetical protein